MRWGRFQRSTGEDGGGETEYKQVEQVHPRMTSRSASFRAIMFYVSLFMYNTWVVEQYRADSSYDLVTLALVAYATAMAALESCRIVGQPYDVVGSAQGVNFRLLELV